MSATLGDQIAFWWAEGEGLSVTEISRMLGCARSTVYRNLEEDGLWERDSSAARGGAPRKEKCSRGHEFAKHGVELAGGGRQCMVCRRMTDREWKRKNWHEKKVKVSA